MTIKILQLCLVLDELQTKPSLKQIFQQYHFAKIIFEVVTYINLTGNLTLF